MPLILLFTLLVCSFSALAQPLEGPFTLCTTPETAMLSTPRIVQQSSSGAKLFFVQSYSGSNSTQYSADYSFDTRQTSSVVAGLAGGYVRVMDAMGDWGEGGLVLIAQESDSARAYLLTQHGSVRIFCDEWHGHPWWGGSHVTDAHLWPRVGGGVVVTTQIETAWGYEGDTFASVDVFPSYVVQPDWSYLFMPYGYLAQSGGYMAASTARDSVAFFTQEYAQSQWWFLPTSDSLPQRVASECALSDLGQLDNGELRALSAGSQPNTIAVVAPGFDGSCRELGNMPASSHNTLAMAWHPHLGFALLTADSATLFLARMDTSGQTVQAEAIFQRVDTNFRVTDGGLMLLNNTVYVVWCERAYRQPGIARLQLASVGWDTHLGADDPRHVFHPSNLTLSASPNPFNSELEILYDLPRTCAIRLSVYNLIGQKVATLFEGARSAGPHRETWIPTCGSGVYFVQLKTADAVRTTRVAYIR